MYGIFHTALCDLVRNNFDANLWQQVVNRAGLSEDHFLRAKEYDDEISFKLFNTAAAVLDISVDQLFEKLGLQFITDSASHLINTLTMGSRPGFDHSILGMHEMVATLSRTMPGFSMGRFPAESLGDGRYRLEYASARSGMVPFVRGMIFGIANLYAKRITVETHPGVESSTEHGAVFLITEKGENKVA